MTPMGTSGRDDKNGERSLGHPIPDNIERFALESQIRECFGRCAYTHKTHEKMAERHASTLYWMKWVQIILSALTSGGAIAVLFDKDSKFFAYATAFISVTLLIVNSYVKDLNPGQNAQKHRDTASDIWNVREAYLSLLADIKDASTPLQEFRERRDELQRQLFKIYHAAPHTTGKAYSAAQDALKSQEELTFSDAEIDAFLPGPLKRAGPRSPSDA
jgi:hypothetical protein